MIFKQIHSLPTGPNWNKILLITIGAVVTIYVTHKVVEHYKIKAVPKDGTDNNAT